MPNVLLVGAFGQCNPGDEALLAAFLRSLPPGAIVAASRTPRATEMAHGCEAIPSTSSRAIASALRRVDAIVVGGGTVFKTLHPTTGRSRLELLRNTLVLARAARTFGTPLLMVGIGAGALASRSAQRLSRWIVPCADLLVLRDEESAAVLTGIGARAPFRVGADPAWVLLDAPPAERRHSSDEVVFALSHLGGTTDLADTIAAHVRSLQRSGFRVALQPWQVDGGDDDLRLAHRVEAHFEHRIEVLDPPGDLREARRRYEDACAVVGMRFHALVAAAAAGTPFVAVDHELKLGALARRLAQPAVAINDAPERVTAAVSTAAASTPPEASVIRRQIALAEEGFRLLRLVLESGSGSDADELDGLPLAPSPWEVST